MGGHGRWRRSRSEVSTPPAGACARRVPSRTRNGCWVRGGGWGANKAHAFAAGLPPPSRLAVSALPAVVLASQPPPLLPSLEPPSEVSPDSLPPSLSSLEPAGGEGIGACSDARSRASSRQKRPEGVRRCQKVSEGVRSDAEGTRRHRKASAAAQQRLEASGGGKRPQKTSEPATSRHRPACCLLVLCRASVERRERWAHLLGVSSGAPHLCRRANRPSAPPARPPPPCARSARRGLAGSSRTCECGMGGEGCE